MGKSLKLKPSQLIAGRIYIKKGKRYSFGDRPFMRAVFNDPGRYILMKTARQISKSTTLAGKALTKMEAHSPYTVLFTAPEMDQTKKFSYDRVQPTIDSSPDIKALVSKEDIKNVYEKSFSNGSKYYLKYAKSAADSCRGISCDEWHCDEVQDVILKNVEPVIQESMFASEYGFRMYSGTPKSFENGIESKLWKRSDQREWMVRCHHHGKLPYHQKMTLKNVGVDGQICDRCGNPLNVRDGIWIRHRTKTDQGEPVHIHGYHISQIMLPTTEHGGVLKWFDFKLELKNADSENWVLNEKFGESADSAEKPITEDDLKAICTDRDMATEPEEWMKKRTWWAGIDWGLGLGSSTVLTIGCTGPDDVFEYTRLRRWTGDDCDPKIVIPAIAYELRRFRIKHVHCDFGGAVDMNVRLQEEGFSVSTNYWSANATQVYEKDVFGITRYTMNRSIEMSDFFADIKKHRIRINMKWTDFQPFSEDILCIFREQRKTKQEHQLPFFDHPDGTMDDSCHSMIYTRLAATLSQHDVAGHRSYDPFAAPMASKGKLPKARDPFR